MIKKISYAFLISFFFLNMTFLFNYMFFKVFLILEYSPYFLEKNFTPNFILRLYSFLAILVYIMLLFYYNIRGLLRQSLLISFTFLFFLWYSDIILYEYIDLLFKELKNNVNIIHHHI